MKSMCVAILLCCSAAPANSEETADTLRTTSLQEVTVTGQSAHGRVAYGKLGSESLELGKLATTPQLFGETDLIKSISLLPGVSNEADGAGGFEVRGGNAYQNLVTLDGMTLYNPAHMMGIFSTFNDDAISRATLYKGPVPVMFGGATSSVLETSMKPGSMTGYDFSGTIGILNVKVTASGPIVRDKLSFAVAARRSYVDLFLKLITKYSSTVMNFTDINAKLRYKISGSDMVDISFFAARDNLAISRLMSMRLGNLAGSANWYSSCGDNWHFTTTAAISNYTTRMVMDLMDCSQEMSEYIRSFALKESAGYEISDGHSLNLGFRSELLRVKSGNMSANGSRQYEIRSGWQNALWLGYDGTLSSRFSVSAGVRLSAFSALTAGSFYKIFVYNEAVPESGNKTYTNLEPRGSIKFSINDCHSLRAGASLSTQNLHGIRSTSTTFPFDRYALTSSWVRPERGTQYSAGYTGMTAAGEWDWSLEAYYKSMRNVYDYRDGMSMFSRVCLENSILGGKGRSYGLELMLRKNTGRLTGWISYTLSKTETKIPGINHDKWYNASNDRRHDVSVVGIYNLSGNWKLSAAWTYSSGRPLTAPDAKFELSGTTCYYYSGRNTYMTPASHRLDLSATYTRVGKRVTSIWSFGIFNTYGYYSPFVIYFEDDPDKPSGTRAVQQSLFGIIPSVSYTIKF